VEISNIDHDNANNKCVENLFEDVFALVILYIVQNIKHASKLKNNGNKDQLAAKYS
jgi:hypothetical protein